MWFSYSIQIRSRLHHARLTQFSSIILAAAHPYPFQRRLDSYKGKKRYHAAFRCPRNLLAASLTSFKMRSGAKDAKKKMTNHLLKIRVHSIFILSSEKKSRLIHLSGMEITSPRIRNIRVQTGKRARIRCNGTTRACKLCFYFFCFFSKWNSMKKIPNANWGFGRIYDGCYSKLCAFI